jgi:hypothetical protein
MEKSEDYVDFSLFPIDLKKEKGYNLALVLQFKNKNIVTFL